MATRSQFLTPFRVGLVVIAGIVAFFVLLSFVAGQQYNDKQTYRVHATFTDATGLGPKSRVQIAGIEVGIIDKIELTADAKARATLKIRKDVPLRADARITKRSASLLGDFLLDVFPGSPNAPLLADGAEIGKVVAQAGVDDVFAALGDVTRQIEGIVRDLGTLVKSNQDDISKTIKKLGMLAETLTRTVDSSSGHLDAILADVEALTGSIRGLARSESGNIKEILANVKDATSRAALALETINKIVGSGEGDLKEGVASVKETLDELQRTLKGAQGLVENVDKVVKDSGAVVASVNRGEGTVGKLLKDDGIAKQLDLAIADVRSLTKPIAELQTHVGIREELHYRTGKSAPAVPSGKASLAVRLVPRKDKFYGVEIVSEPRGRTSRETVTRRNPDTGALVTSEEIVTTDDELKFSAYFGKRFGPAALRVGLIESTGGVGADVYAADDKLRLSVDAFDWSNPDARFPRLRASAQFNLLENVYVGGGIDDALNVGGMSLSSDGRRIKGGTDFFVTGGLQFNDEDLKALLTIMGVPSVGGGK